MGPLLLFNVVTVGLSLIFHSFSIQATENSIYDDFFSHPKYDVFMSQSPVIVPIGKSPQDMLQDNDLFMKEKGTNGFICNIPPPTNRKSPPVTQAANPNGLKSILSALKTLHDMRKACLYHFQDWWSYEYCHERHLRQFHQGSDGVLQAEYFIGKHPNRVGDRSGTSVTRGDIESTTPPSHVRVEEMGGRKWLVLVMSDGTMCDLTNKPRKTEVQFHCNPHEPEQIHLIKETATCEYLLVIHTPRLCNDPSFKVEAEDTHELVCRPVYMLDEAHQHLNPPKDTLQIPPDIGSEAYYKRIEERGEREITPILYPISDYPEKRNGASHMGDDGHDSDSDSDSEIEPAADVDGGEHENLQRNRNGSPNKAGIKFHDQQAKNDAETLEDLFDQIQSQLLLRQQKGSSQSDEDEQPALDDEFAHLGPDTVVEVVVVDANGQQRRMRMTVDKYREFAREVKGEIPSSSQQEKRKEQAPKGRRRPNRGVL